MKSAWFFSTNPDYLSRVRANNASDLTPMSMVAIRAALTEGEDWLNQVVAYIEGNHDFVEAYVRDKMPLVRYEKAQGTYLAWLDVRPALEKIGASQVAADASTPRRRVTPETILERWFVENAKVQVNAGSSYGTGGAGHMRMNLATSRKLVQLALDNMASALRNA
jgi:cystathionine beta-lyase